MSTLSKLRKWRDQHGLSIEDLSDLTGISESMLSRAERGERQIAPLRRVALARALGVRVRDIFDVPSRPEAS